MTPAGIGGGPQLRRVVLIYVASSVLSMVVVAAATAVVSWRIAQVEALRSAEVLADRVATLVVGPRLPAVLAGDVETRDELDRALEVRLRDGSVLAVTVRRFDGTAVYSSASPVGPVDRVDVSAPGGRVDTATTARTQPLGVGVDPETGLVEAFVPVDAASPSSFTAQVSLPPDRVEEAAARVALLVLPLGLGALLVLQAVQFPIVLTLVRRAARHEAERGVLVRRALSASETERRRIAGALHDDVVQDLAGAGYALDALARSADPRHAGVAGRLGAVVRDAVVSLRLVMADLYPPEVSGSELVEAIEVLATRLRAQGIDVTVRLGPADGIEPATAAALYRVVREALANVVKHARASTVRIELTACDGAPGVVLRVADDGIGAPEDAIDDRVDGHLGLRLITDRLAEVGGGLTVRRFEPTGTVVEARVPSRGDRARRVGLGRR